MAGSDSSTPPDTTPPDITVDASALANDDIRVGRKREREVSVEPYLPPYSKSDEEAGNRGRESRTKKNKTLGEADSEEDSPPRNSVALAAAQSPLGPKVTQIRKRVKDMTWQEGEPQPASQPVSEEDTLEDMPGVETSSAVGTSDAAPSDDKAHAIATDPVSDADDQQPAATTSAEHTETSASETSAPAAIPTPVTPESEAESDAVAPLPGTASEAIPRQTDKSLKRKSRDSVFFVSGDVPEDESHKRSKEDPEVVPKPSAAPPATPPRAKSPNKFNGFASYSSASSPFLKGTSTKSVFDEPAATSPKPKSGSSAFGTTSSIFAKFSTPKSPSRTTSPAPKPSSAFASSGFSAFASRPSPFLTAAAGASPAGSPSAFGVTRSGSPSVFGSSPAPKGSVPKANEAFGSFSGGAARFGASAAAKAKSPKSDDEAEGAEDSDKSGTNTPSATFSEILAAKSSETEEERTNKVANLEALTDMHTGEEHETTLQQLRAKLYTMDSQDTYKEKGTGMLKVNVRKSDGKGARLVMRADGVLRLLMNASLFPGMSCSIGQDPKFIKISTLESGAFVHHAIKVGNPKSAAALVELIHENIPERTTATPAKTPSAEDAV